MGSAAPGGPLARIADAAPLRRLAAGLKALCTPELQVTAPFAWGRPGILRRIAPLLAKSRTEWRT